MAIFDTLNTWEKAQLKNFMESAAIKDLIETTGCLDQVFIKYQEYGMQNHLEACKLAIYLSTLGIDMNELPAYFKVEIPQDAFAHTRISNPKFSNTLLSISSDAFLASAIETLILPPSITEVDNFAFYRCENLRIVEFPDTHMKKFSRMTFADCDALEKFTLPRSWDDSFNFGYLPESCDIYYRGTTEDFSKNQYSSYSIPDGKVARIIECSDGIVEI